jgi:hypothetical protein
VLIKLARRRANFAKISTKTSRMEYIEARAKLNTMVLFEILKSYAGSVQTIKE